MSSTEQRYDPPPNPGFQIHPPTMPVDGEQLAPSSSPRGPAQQDSNLLNITNTTTRSGNSDAQSATGRHGSRARSEYSLLPQARQFLSRGHGQRTELHRPNAVMTRAFPHKYLIRRPRALQYTFNGKLIEAGDQGEFRAPDPDEYPGPRETALEPKQSHGSEAAQTRATDCVDIQRGRLELFIDLLWVGIISNLSEHFFEQSFGPETDPGSAMAEFLLLFLPAWSMWSRLQQFLSSYYMDDMIQRVILVWVLILALMWGNNAPYFLRGDRASSWQIINYLVVIDTLLITEAIYSIFIPWLRRTLLVGFILGAPLTGLWIATAITHGITQEYLLMAAIIVDFILYAIMQSPIADMLLGNGFRKAIDVKHTNNRFENFFIIALGEGVFLLIRSSPLGGSFSEQFARGVNVFLCYFALHWLYFNGDQSRTFVHAGYRRWYLRVLWKLFHIPLYGSLVLLASGNLYLIDYTSDGESNGVISETASSARRLARRSTGIALFGRQESGGGESGGESGGAVSEPTLITDEYTLRIATVTVYASIAVALASMLAIALVNKTMDPPRTLIVNNRYVRLLPRAMAVVFFSLIWLVEFTNPSIILTIAFAVLIAVMIWEWDVSLECGGGVFEPELAHIHSYEKSRKSSRRPSESKAEENA